jgi:hypothetical protein
MMCRVGCCCVGRRPELWKLCALVVASLRSRCKIYFWFCIAILGSALITTSGQTEPHATLTLQGLSSSHLVFDRIQAWQAFSVLLRIVRSPCSAFSCEARWRLSKSLQKCQPQLLSWCLQIHVYLQEILHGTLEVPNMVPKKHRPPAPWVKNVKRLATGISAGLTLG